MPTVDLERIRVDGGTQCRASLTPDTVKEYAESYTAGKVLPPVVAFDDGEYLWMADGFHRRAGRKLAKFEDIEADIRPGTVRDALLYSAGCNGEHGLRRTNEDKRQAISLLLADEEWASRSDRWIADQCHVEHHLVARVRSARSTGGKPSCDDNENGNEENNSDKTTSGDQQSDESAAQSTSTNGSSQRSKDTDEHEQSEEESDTADESTNGAAKKTRGRDGRSRGKPKTKEPILCEKCKRMGPDPYGRECKDCTELRKQAKKKPAKKKEEESSSNGTEEDRPALTDHLGHAVPAISAEAFGNVSAFKEIDSLTRQLQKQIDELSRLPGGEQLRRQLQPTGSEGNLINKSEHLNALKRDLRFTRPYSICPYCSAKGKPACKGCNGTGWVTETCWNGAPDDVKARLS
jgi:hypothetical protein